MTMAYSHSYIPLPMNFSFCKPVAKPIDIRKKILEVKEKSKEEEVKEDVKEEGKEEVKEEVKEEAKEETKEEEGLSAVEPFKRVTKDDWQMSSAVKQIAYELKEMGNLNFGGDQVQVEMEDDSPFMLIITLTPNDGIYKDGHFRVRMNLPHEYPKKKPTFNFITQVFHPNVDPDDGDICFSLLDESSDSLRVADYAHGLLWLLYHPNLFDPLNDYVPSDEKEYVALVRKTIQGGTIDGYVYARSPCLPKLEEGGEEAILELRGECGEKSWVWKLEGEEWVQVFE